MHVPCERSLQTSAVGTPIGMCGLLIPRGARTAGLPILLLMVALMVSYGQWNTCAGAEAGPDCRTRVIVTTDGEADGRCSMVRFLLTSNEFDVEAIVKSSSQFHWEGGTGWNAFHPVSWVKDQIDLYAEVYDNLLLQDPSYPSPGYLLSRWKVGMKDSASCGGLTEKSWEGNYFG